PPAFRERAALQFFGMKHTDREQSADRLAEKPPRKRRLGRHAGLEDRACKQRVADGNRARLLSDFIMWGLRNRRCRRYIAVLSFLRLRCATPSPGVAHFFIPD